MAPSFLNFQNLPGCDFYLKFVYFTWTIMKRRKCLC
nr:MAG TPA: hypothetical protein [Caudoviricetes sp.]